MIEETMKVTSNEINKDSSHSELPLHSQTSSPNLYKEKCKLCCTFQARFYCRDCISNGNFHVTSQETNSETYVQKLKRLDEIRIMKKEKASVCRILLKKQEVKDSLPSEINECRERILMLKQLIQEKKDSTVTLGQNHFAIRDKNTNRQSKLPRYKERVEKLASYVRTMKKDNEGRRERLSAKKLALKKIVQKNINDLITYVFPITKINPTSRSGEGDMSEIENALADASKTSFVRGTWVLMDSSGELHHQIVAPTLPSSGDYSAYLAVQNENGVPITEKIGTNEAYNVGAALCYTTQLINLLAFYLDVILPKKVTYADFCLKELTDKQFYRKVAHLNTNVLYLCFSQGMDSVLLNPKHTLNNILHLVSHDDLGRTGPFQVDSGLMLGLEYEEIAHRSDDGSEEEEDHIPWEWEAIPLVACPESVPGSSMSHTQATTSIAGGLVTSLASMFRGWSGK